MTHVSVLLVLTLPVHRLRVIGIFLKYGLAWLFGGFNTAVSIAGKVLSRTVELSGEIIHEWDTIGIVSLVTDGARLLIYAIALTRRVIMRKLYQRSREYGRFVKDVSD